MYACGYVHKKDDGDGLKIEKLHRSADSHAAAPPAPSSSSSSTWFVVGLHTVGPSRHLGCCCCCYCEPTDYYSNAANRECLLCEELLRPSIGRGRAVRQRSRVSSTVAREWQKTSSSSSSRGRTRTQIKTIAVGANTASQSTGAVWPIMES
jgi:hypothetical protein